MTKVPALEIGQIFFRKLLDYSLIFFCLFSSLNVLGQHPTTFNDSICETGPAYPRIDAPEKYYFSRGDTIISFKIKKDEVYIQKFDKTSLNQVSVGKAENLHPEAKFEGFIELPGKLLFLYRILNEDSIGLYCREVDFSSGNLASKAHHIFNEDVGIWEYNKELNHLPIEGSYDMFEMKISPDSSKMVVKYIKGDYQKELAVGLAVFDCNNNYNRMWNVVSLLPISLVQDFTVDNEGKVFLTGWLLPKKYISKNEPVIKLEKELLLIRFSGDNPDTSITRIDFAGKFLTGASISALPNGKIQLVGYFRHRDAVHQGIYVTSRPELRWDFNVSNGTFIYHFNSNGQVVDQAIEDFPAEMSNVYYSNKTKSSGAHTPPGIWALEKKSLNINADGGSIFVGEQYEKVVIDRPQEWQGASTSTEYRFCNLVVMQTSPEGKISAIQNLRKYQRSDDAHDRSSVSYMFAENDSDYFFFFLNHISNLRKKTSEYWNAYLDGRRDGYMAVYRVDKSTGKSSLFPLFDINNVNDKKVYEVSPFRVVKVGENDFVMEAFIGDNTDCLLKFSVPKH